MDGGGGNGDGIATVGPALPPINVARPSEAVAIPVTNDGEEMAGPRKVRPLASSRFKRTNGSANNNSEPKPLARVHEEMGDSPKSPPGTPRSPGTYDLFKTRSRKFSGPLEKLEKNSGPLGRQVSRMRSRRHRGDGGEDVEAGPCKEQLEQRAEDENGGGMKTALSANRYFQALSGPELEDVKDKENLLLPHDEKWPFPIGTFGVALGLGSQTMLWKTLGQVPEMAFLHIPLWINFYLWCLALLCFIVVFFTYMLKVRGYRPWVCILSLTMYQR